MQSNHENKAANNLKPENQHYLENRLHQWAEWYSRKEDNGLGFPSESNEYKMQTYGNVPRGTPGPKPLPVHPAAQEVEETISMMATKNSQTEQYAAALRHYYLEGRENKRKAAKIMCVSEAQFYIFFNGALCWLDGWFTGKYGSHYFLRTLLYTKC